MRIDAWLNGEDVVGDGYNSHARKARHETVETIMKRIPASCVVRHVTPTMQDEITTKQWCRDNLKGQFVVLMSLAFFEHLEDGALFKLRWGT